MWCALEKVYKGCVNFNWQSRLSLDKAATILSTEENDFVVSTLKISKPTAVEQFDQKLANHLHEGGHEEAVQAGSILTNDSTNGCAFLSVKIVDTILTKMGTEGDLFAKVAGPTKDTIWLLPEKINPYRNLSKMYDPKEAYFAEAYFADGIYSVEGRQKLHSKLCELGRGSFAAIFTGDPRFGGPSGKVSYGTNHSCGVMTLIRSDLGFEPKCVNVDSQGHYIFLDTVVQGAKYLIANVYGPIKSSAANSFL